MSNYDTSCERLEPSVYRLKVVCPSKVTFSTVIGARHQPNREMILTFFRENYSEFSIDVESELINVENPMAVVKYHRK
jgi:hypothetical protein